MQTALLRQQTGHTQWIVPQTWIFAAVVGLLLGGVRAPGATLVQDFYLPLPETQIRNTFVALQSTGIGTTLDSTFSIVVTAPGTVIYYDQWEDGYEIDLQAPTQATTQIWGDGIDSNGIPPGFVHDPTNLAAGTVLTLRNQVPLPRNPATILFDGRDRVAATKAVVVARAAWATTPGTVLATAVEVPATMDYGRSFIVPVGQNVSANSMFEYAGVFVMAGQDGTSVTIDPDGAGPSNAVTVALNRGESYQYNGGIMKGATIAATKPVQVHLATGDIGANYESRWFRLYPVEQWFGSYITPVGTSSNGNPAYVYLFNTNQTPLTVSYENRVGSGSVTVPASNGLYQFQMPQNSGGRFTSAGNQAFYALETVGANPSANNVYDWGFTLMPANDLTPEAVVGWGSGSSDLTQNGSPVWVTPVTATRVYVDYNGDGVGAFTNSKGRVYDVAYDLAALESKRVYDPDKDQTAMRLFTDDGTTIAAVWGEDPAVAGPGNPFIDAGTTVIPFPSPVFTKTSALVVDNSPPGLSTNDILEYTLTINNRGLLPLGNTVVMDEPPTSLVYQASSTTLNGAPIADHTDLTPFPLGPPQGYTIPIILPNGTSAFKYQARIIGYGTIANKGSFSGGLTSSNTVIVPPPSGAHSNTIVFASDVSGTPTTTYYGGDGIFVKLTDPGVNQSTTSVESVSVIVRDTTSGDYQTITLVETGPNTGVFINTVALPSSLSAGASPEDGTLKVAAGDSLSVAFTDPLFGDSCNAAASVLVPTLTKVLYLSTTGGVSQVLDRIDPAAAGLTNTLQTAELGGTGGASSPIGVDAVSTSATVAATLTFAHTTTSSGTNRLMLVGVSIGHQDESTATNVTYNGVKLTNVVQVTSGAASEPRVQIWRLLNPATGSNNVVVQFSAAPANGAVVGAITFTNVDQTTPLGVATSLFNSAQGGITATVASATGELVFDVVGGHINGGSLSAGSGQTTRWNRQQNHIWGGGGTKTGATSVAVSWTGSAGTDWAIAGVSIKPAAGGGGATFATFTQTPAFSLPFSMASGAVVRVTNFVTVVSGSMPANPSINAILSHAGTNIVVLTNATYSSATSNIVWTGTLPAAANIPVSQAISLVVTTFQTGVSFNIDYGSSNRPSKVLLPTTNVIQVGSLGVYGAAYPGTNLLSSAPNGSQVYVRLAVTDPFGAYDISSVNLRILDPSGGTNVNVTLTNSSVVASNSYSKTYEYAWSTPGAQGNYSIAVTANEGTEGIQASAGAVFPLTFLDLGTPGTTEFYTGSNGLHTLTYSSNETVFVRVQDLDRNTNTGLVETVTVVITNLTRGDYEIRTLTETAPNTGVFTGSVAAAGSGASVVTNGTLTVWPGDQIHVTYVDPGDPTDISSDDAVILQPPGVPGMRVTKALVTPADGQAVVGEAVQFDISVINSGSTTLSNILVRDVYPTNVLSLLSASPPQDTLGGGTATWNNVGTLLPGERADLSLHFSAIGTANPATNFATAVSSVTNSSSATVVVTRPAVAVTKTLISPTNGPASVGDNVVFAIVVRNTGTTTINPLPLEDTYSAAYYQLVSASNAPSVGAGSLLWTNLGPLSAGGAITNIVTLKAIGGSSNAANEAAVNYAVDVNGDPVPASGSSTGVVMLAATVSGTAYYDQDSNNMFSGGDIPLPGITLNLYTDPSGSGTASNGVLVAMALSDASGYYEFLNLPTGRYVVVQSDTLIYTNLLETGPAPTNNNAIPVNVTNLTIYGGNNFLDVLPAAIVVNAFEDINGNGLVDAADTNRIGGATLVLLDAASNVAAVAVTTTGAPVAFTNLLPGTYRVVETNATGYLSTAPMSDQLTVTVWSGQTGTGTFLDALPATIGGVVVRDINGDGTKQAAETNGIPSVKVVLYNTNGVALATNLTDSAGAFAFTGLLPGSYVLVETDPAGYVSTGNRDGAGTNNTLSVTVQSGQTSSGNYFLDTAPTSVSGGVFVDLNGDGVVQAGDTNPIAGVTVTLLDATNGVVGTTTTAASGAYAFTNVMPGSYTVRETDLAGYLSTLPTNNLLAVTVTSGTPVTGKDFYDTAYAAINGNVFVDVNGNGAKDGADTNGIGGVTVTLRDATNGVVASTSTAASGAYSFTNVAPGTYGVVETDPGGYVSTGNRDGAGTNNTLSVTVQSGQTSSGNYFLDSQPTSVSGGVFIDVNGDGVVQAGDTNPIAGVTVALLNATNGVVAATTTAASGAYAFTNVMPGSYTVRETDLAGYLSTLPTNNLLAVTVTSGTPVTGKDFYDTAYAAINGNVFIDVNGNGAKDGADTNGIGGVTMTLRDATNGVVATATTAASGAYSFTNVAPGAYSVGETDPGGYVSTGNRDGAGTNNTLSVTVQSGQTSSGNYFLDSQPTSVSGGVFIDVNGDGVVQAGDTNPIAGVTVTLLDATNGVVATTTTAASGAYAFTNVMPGSYTVRETDLAGYLSTLPTNNLLAVTVTSGTPVTGKDFYDTGYAAISGNVFIDVNGNGAQDGADTNGIAGVVVLLYDTNGVALATNTTEVAGAYSFTNLPPETYVVVETDPAGYVSTGDKDGTATTNRIVVVVTSGGASTSNYFLDTLAVPPAVVVVKTAGNTADGQVRYILSGADVVYAYNVINTGGSYLGSLVVTDNVLGVVGVLAGPVAPGGTNTLYATNVAVSADVTNTVIVTATPVEGSGLPLGYATVSGTDDAVVDVVAPAFTVAKTASPDTILSGAAVTYTYTVRNTGDTALTNVVVTDDKLGPIGNVALLAAGASTNLTAITNILADVVNVATVVGQPADTNGVPLPGFAPVTNTASASVDVVGPAFTVAKTASPDTILAGAAVTYTYTVRNTGDTALTNVVVTDDKLGPIGNVALLAAGASTNLTATTNILADVANVATVVGQPADTNGVPLPGFAPMTNTASASVDVVGPAFTVAKTASPDTILAGAAVTYTYTVRNTGDTALTNVVVTDDKLGPIGNVALLAAGASTNLTATTNILADVANVATVVGQPADTNGVPLPGFAPMTNTASASVEVVAPAFTVAKTASPDTILAGAAVTYTYTVRNTGDTALTNVVVTDDKLGPIGSVALLAAGASTNLTAITNILADVVNVATVVGQPADTNGVPLPGFAPMTNTASASVDVVGPAFTVAKTASPDTILAGAAVTYTYTVRNTGDTALTNVVVTDDKLGPIGNVALLAAGASTNLTATTNILADVANVATVVGQPADTNGVPLPGFAPLTNTASASVDVVGPAFTVAKTASPDTILSGAAVTYTYTVRNTGDTALTNVVVTDDKLGPIGNVALLAPGASTNLTATTNILADVANVATVVGQPADTNGVPLPGFAPMTNTASASVEVVAPAFTVAKTASPDTILAGAAVTYTYTVRNTGDTALTNVVVTDDKLGPIGSVALLAAGASTNLTAITNILADVVNVATVVGQPADTNGVPLPGFAPLTNTASASVDVVGPAFTVAKTASPDTILSGAAVTYTYTVRNTGDTALTNVVVTDDKLGPIGNVALLAPGASTNLTATTNILADVANVATVVGQPADTNGVPLPGFAPMTNTASASVDVVAPDLSVVKTVSLDGSVPGIKLVHGTSGMSVTYSFVVANTGDVAITNVAVKDAAISFSTNLGTLAVGQVVTVSVASAISGDLTNTVRVTGDDPTGHTVVKTDTAQVDEIHPGYRVAKTLTAPTGRPAGLGERLQFTIDITNTGDVDLVSLTVNDRYETGYLAFADAVPLPAEDVNDGMLTWTNIGPLAVGASTSLVVNFTAAGSSAGAAATNTAEVASTLPAGMPRTAAAVYSVVTVGCSSSKTVISPAGGRAANVGEEVDFRIRVTNTGEVTLVTVPLQDSYETNYLTFLVASPMPDDSANDGVLNWSKLGPLAPGESVTITTRYTAASSSLGLPRNNVVVVSSTAGELQPPVVTLTNIAPYTVVRVDFDPSKELISPTNRPTLVGEEMKFRISVTNTGDVVFDSITITDVYETNYLAFVSAVPPCDDTNNDGELTWSGVGPLAAGASTSLVVTLRATDLTAGGRMNLAIVEPHTPMGDPPARSVTNSAPYSTQYGWIGGTVWMDADGNGRTNEDLTKNGLNGVVVLLSRTQGGFPFAQTTTATSGGRSGYYRFDGLSFGEYWVAVDLQTVPPNLRSVLTAPSQMPMRALLTTNASVMNADFGFNVANPTAVGLLYFRGSKQGAAAFLEWATAMERDNLGFNVYRSDTEAGQRVRLNARMIDGSGTGAGQAYSWTDANLAPSGSLVYWLEDVAYDGQTTWHGPVRLRMGEEKPAPVQFGSVTGAIFVVRAETLAKAGFPVYETDADRLTVRVDDQAVPIYSTASGGPMRETDFLVFSLEGLSATNIAVDLADEKGSRMEEVYVGPESNEGDIWYWRTGYQQTVRFETVPAQKRYLLLGFTGDTVWMFDVTDARTPKILIGAEWLALENEFGVYLGNPATSSARCIAIGTEAAVELIPKEEGR